MSTSTISLPRPFILTKGWPASALMVGLSWVRLYMAESMVFASYAAGKGDQPCNFPARQAFAGVVKVAAGWPAAAGFYNAVAGPADAQERSMLCLGRSLAAAAAVMALALAGPVSSLAQAPTAPAPAAPAPEAPAPSAPAPPAPAAPSA